MTPIRIRATLVHGYISRDPWSPALDGILAAVVQRRRLGPDAYVLGGARPSELQTVTGLPIAWRTVGADGWYAVSSPIPVGAPERYRAHFHRRFDDQHERFLPQGTRKVLTAAGPYKATRLFDTLILVPALEFFSTCHSRECRRFARQ